MATDNEQKNKEEKITRPPIVVVMGHIDHGKTKLLDAIRKTNLIDKAAGGEPRPVSGRESGGITQHIGAYEVEVDSREGKKKITFIDTPGHEAFSKMRARGAHVADIAILVIAADDGVKPQTIEALDTIRKANIPFIVAINKIDKTNADPERVKKELADHNVLVEEWGGKIPAVLISAKQNEGVYDLLEMILLVADLENLEADTTSPPEGVIVESHLDPKRGNTATLLLTKGTLREGEFIVAGGSYAPVRIFEDFLGSPIESALPSKPVCIAGFSDIPEVGIPFTTVASKKEAEEKIRLFIEKTKLPPSPTIHIKRGTDKNEKSLSAQETAADAEKPYIITLVIKADMAGSLEAIEEELKKLNTENVCIKIIKKGVGSLNEDDAKVAGSTKGSALIGFHVKIEKEVMPLAERFGFVAQTFDIIYDLVEWLQEYIKKITPQTMEEKIIGEAQILKLFSKKGTKQIAGGRVTSGSIKNKARVTIIRRGHILARGRIVELQQRKIEATEIPEGNEFGARIDAPVEIAEKDTIEIIE